MIEPTSLDNIEVSKFAKLASTWWDVDGPLKTLHDINPTRIEYILKYAALNHQKVLDIGCGGGILCEAMASYGAQVTGIDANQDIIECAKQHANENKLSVHYQAVLIEKYLPKSHSKFDVITCLEMLEHVSDPEVIIKHAARLLKPNGVFILSTINRTFSAYASVIVAAEYLLNLLPKQTHDYSKFIKPSELARVLRRYNLVIESISGMDYNPFTRQSRLSDKVDCNYLVSCRIDAT